MFYEFKHPIRADYFKVEAGTDFSFPAHMHHCFELVITTSGEMTITSDKTEYNLGKGEALLIFPNQIHSFETSRSSTHILCLFSPNLVSAYTNATKGKLPQSGKFIPDSYLIEKLCSTTGNEDIIYIKGLLYSFVSQFHVGAHYQSAHSPTEPLLYRIFRFIEENYMEGCTLAELASGIGYEYTYLSRYFKKSVGMSYNDYVNNYRISKACYLLTNENCTILEVSEKCGFNSLRSFNRNFKELIGCSPAEYKKQE